MRIPWRLAALLLMAGLAVSMGGEAPASGKEPALKVHPKVFSMISGWLSDSEAPVVLEISLNAVAASRNQFDASDMKQDGAWWQAPGKDGTDGFMRYRATLTKDGIYDVEYQENGGGSLTSAYLIRCKIEQRQIEQEGKPVTLRVLRVLSFRARP